MEKSVRIQKHTEDGYGKKAEIFKAALWRQTPAQGAGIRLFLVQLVVAFPEAANAYELNEIVAE